MEETRLGIKALEEQAVLLMEWNKENINGKPEQVRMNIETLCNLVSTLSKSPMMR